MSTKTGMSVLALVAGIILPSIPAFAFGPEIRFHPAVASGNVFCTPGEGACGEDEIILSEGGVTVTLLLLVSDWDSAGGGHPGDPDYWLGALQGNVDSRTYDGGRPENPGTLAGVDLLPVGQPDMGFEGAFQALKVCAGPPYSCEPTLHPLSRCTSAADCPAGLLCMDRCDFVFYQLDATCTVSTATIDYSWSCASADCREDPRYRISFYLGTLLLEVPIGAQGTYNVDFTDDVNFTLFNTCPGLLMPGLVLVPGSITIIPGATDCNDNGVPDEFERDSDGDGAIDECEGCPDDPNKTEPGVCGCGADDDPDADGDGVPDCLDQCPGVDDAVFAPDCAGSIPTVSAWGVLALTLLLLVAAKVQLLRRAPVAGRSHTT